MKLTNKCLVAHCKLLLTMLTVYVYGTYGKILTTDIAESKAKQYPSQNTQSRLSGYLKLVGNKYYALDCVGLIKAYLWGGIDNIKYVSSTDKSANGMYLAASKKGNIDYKTYKHGVPEVQGLAVQMNGHIGVYIGNGKVIESTPNTKYAKQSHKLGGVCETKVTDRKWEHWLYIPYIEYIVNPYEEPTRTIYYDTSKKKVVCTGEDVKYVQYVIGADCDGRFGPASDKALRAWQKQNGLTVDGRFGAACRKKAK